MKRLSAVIVSAVILVCCIVPVSAAGNYTYIAPAWLTFLGEEDGIKMWAAPDYSSLLMLLTAENKNGRLITDIISDKTFDVNEFLGNDVSENFDIKSRDFKTVAGYDCLRASCSVKPGHEYGTFFVSSYKYTIYVFTSDSTRYMFVFGSSAVGNATTEAFEGTFNTFKINETVTPSTSLPSAAVTEKEDISEPAADISTEEEKDSGLILYTEPSSSAEQTAAAGKPVLSGKKALMVKAAPFLAAITLSAAIVLFFVLRKTIKNEKKEEQKTEERAELQQTELPQEPFEEETYLQFDLTSSKSHKKGRR